MIHIPEKFLASPPRSDYPVQQQPKEDTVFNYTEDQIHQTARLVEKMMRRGINITVFAHPQYEDDSEFVLSFPGISFLPEDPDTDPGRQESYRQYTTHRSTAPADVFTVFAGERVR